MKSRLVYKRLIYFFFVAAGVIVFNSCAVYYPDYQVSLPVSDIVKMSKEGVYSKDIIKQIRRSRSVYKLPASELAKLRDEGVRDSVINYMERTNMESILRNQRYQDYWYPGMYGYPYSGFGYPYYGIGFGYGWPYYYYRDWGFRPAIMVHGGGDGRGGSHSRR